MSDISFFITGKVLLINRFANSYYNFFEKHDHFFYDLLERTFM